MDLNFLRQLGYDLSWDKKFTKKVEEDLYFDPDYNIIQPGEVVRRGDERFNYPDGTWMVVDQSEFTLTPGLTVFRRLRLGLERIMAKNIKEE